MAMSREQAALIQQWESSTNFEFMGREKVNASKPSDFVRRWKENVQWLRDVVDAMDREIDEYAHSIEEEK